MVEARQGRSGGHFLVRDSPVDASETTALTAATAALDLLAKKVAELRALTLTVVEFQEIATSTYFGACLHTSSRIAAEQYAITMLGHLGDNHPDLPGIVHRASWTVTDVDRYAIRIHGQTLAGTHTLNDDHTAINGPHRPER